MGIGKILNIHIRLTLLLPTYLIDRNHWRGVRSLISPIYINRYLSQHQISPWLYFAIIEPLNRWQDCR